MSKASDAGDRKKKTAAQPPFVSSKPFTAAETTIALAAAPLTRLYGGYDKYTKQSHEQGQLIPVPNLHRRPEWMLARNEISATVRLFQLRDFGLYTIYALTEEKMRELFALPEGHSHKGNASVALPCAQDMYRNENPPESEFYSSMEYDGGNAETVREFRAITLGTWEVTLEAALREDDLGGMIFADYSGTRFVCVRMKDTYYYF